MLVYFGKQPQVNYRIKVSDPITINYLADYSWSYGYSENSDGEYDRIDMGEYIGTGEIAYAPTLEQAIASIDNLEYNIVELNYEYTLYNNKNMITFDGNNNEFSPNPGAIGLFNGSQNLVEVKNITYKFSEYDEEHDMRDTYQNCSSLKIFPQIQDNVTAMSWTFSDCPSIETIDYLPQGLQKMESTFARCTGLKSICEIPSTVNRMPETFYACTSLGGDIIIRSENVDDIMGIFNETSKEKHVYIPYYKSIVDYAVVIVTPTMPVSCYITDATLEYDDANMCNVIKGKIKPQTIDELVALTECDVKENIVSFDGYIDCNFPLNDFSEITLDANITYVESIFNETVDCTSSRYYPCHRNESEDKVVGYSSEYTKTYESFEMDGYTPYTRKNGVYLKDLNSSATNEYEVGSTRKFFKWKDMDNTNVFVSEWAGALRETDKLSIAKHIFMSASETISIEYDTMNSVSLVNPTILTDYETSFEYNGENISLMQDNMGSENDFILAQKFVCTDISNPYAYKEIYATTKEISDETTFYTLREINDFGTIRYEYNKFVEKATNISMENNVYRFMLNGVEYISKETNSKIWLYKDILEESSEAPLRKEVVLQAWFDSTDMTTYYTEESTITTNTKIYKRNGMEEFISCDSIFYPQSVNIIDEFSVEIVKNGQTITLQKDMIWTYYLLQEYGHDDGSVTYPTEVYIATYQANSDSDVYYRYQEMPDHMGTFKLREHPANITNNSFTIDGVKYIRNDERLHYYSRDMLNMISERMDEDFVGKTEDGEGQEFYSWKEVDGNMLFFTTTETPTPNDVIYEGNYNNGHPYINSNNEFSLNGASVGSDEIRFDYYGFEMNVQRNTDHDGNYILTYDYLHQTEGSSLPIMVHVTDEIPTPDTVIYYIGNSTTQMYKLSQQPSNVTDTSFEIDGVVYNRAVENQPHFYRQDSLDNAVVEEEDSNNSETMGESVYLYNWSGDNAYFYTTNPTPSMTNSLIEGSGGNVALSTTYPLNNATIDNTMGRIETTITYESPDGLYPPYTTTHILDRHMDKDGVFIKCKSFEAPEDATDLEVWTIYTLNGKYFYENTTYGPVGWESSEFIDITNETTAIIPDREIEYNGVVYSVWTEYDEYVRETSINHII